MAVVHDSTERVINDNGNSESRRMIVCDQTIYNEQRSEMIGFHSFTGCDYTSSFFSQGKILLGKSLCEAKISCHTINLGKSSHT